MRLFVKKSGQSHNLQVNKRQGKENIMCLSGVKLHFRNRANRGVYNVIQTFKRERSVDDESPIAF